MTKSEKNRLRKLCQALASPSNAARRPQAAIQLERLLAKEKKNNFTPESAALLRVAEEVFRFLEELPKRRWQDGLQTGHPQMAFDAVEKNVSKTGLLDPSLR